MDDAISSRYRTNTSSQYDHLLKILIIGDSGVGKSSLLLRFTQDIFDNEILSTVGM